MAIFPAVLVDNLPMHLQQNTKKAANVLLGQDRREMMFWRLHTDAPNFLVVFRDTEERNAYFHSPFLQEVVDREGVDASPRLYCKDTDVVLPVGVQGTRRPEGQRQAGGRSWKETFGRSPNKEPPLDLSGPRARLYMPVDKVVAGCGKGGSAFEENTQRTGGGSSLEDCSRTERRSVYEGNPRQEIGNRTLPFRVPATQQSHHHAPLGQYIRQHRASSGPLLPGGRGVNQQPNRSVRLQPRFPVEKKSKRLPFKSVSSEKAATQAYSMRQPPAPPVIGKPVVEDFLFEAKSDKAHVGVTLDSFDLLDQLEMAVAESLGAGKEMVAKAVADSWRNQVTDLEEIHKKVLSSQDSATREATAVRRALTAVYQWRGNSLVTRDKAIVLTGIFLVNNVKKQEQRLLKDLEGFLGANSNFKMTLDEISFILDRNGVTLVDLGQEFDCKTTATDFKTFIQELVALPKQLIANLSDVLFGFFKSRLIVEGAANQNSEVGEFKRRGKVPNKDLAEMFANAEEKFKQKVHIRGGSGKEEFADSPSKEDCGMPAQEKTSQKEEVEVKLLKDELLKHQTERKELEDKLQKLMEEKTSDSKEIQSLKQNFESLKKNFKSNNDHLKQQLDDAQKEKDRRLFVEKKFIESLSLLLEGGDLVDEEFDTAQTKIVGKVKELMQGKTRDEVVVGGGGSATVETEKSSSSAGSSSESLEDSTGCSDTGKGEGELVKVRLFHEAIQDGSSPHRLFTIPGTNLLPLAALQELAPGYKVTALKYRQGGKNKGWRAARVEAGMVQPPPSGWRGKEYVLFTSKFSDHTPSSPRPSSKPQLPPRTTRQRIRA